MEIYKEMYYGPFCSTYLSTDWERRANEVKITETKSGTEEWQKGLP